MFGTGTTTLTIIYNTHIQFFTNKYVLMLNTICLVYYRAAGFNDDIGTYGILSGLWTASFSLGAFIGPSVAGVLYDSVGFRNGTLFVIVIHLILVSLN